MNTKWRFTGFYGSPYKPNEVYSWNDLRKLGLDKGLPWLVNGDFNEILYVRENRGDFER